MKNIPLPFLLMVVLFAVAVSVALWAVIANRQRREVVRRATSSAANNIQAFRPESRSPIEMLFDTIASRVPVQWGSSGTVTASRLEQAGFDGRAAAPLFGLVRVASALLGVALGFALAPDDDPMFFVASLAIGIGAGFMAPIALLDRLTQRRQASIRRGIPDALDLLVVCVEAGVALDASVQRVSRELAAVHPILADELISMSRRISAGMPRDQAMQGLYLRTGLLELRGLASHMLQSEKWGTPIVTVLRMYSEQLRYKRKIAAERRAATASTRMLLPLALFIFPTLFIVLLGPAFMRISGMFDSIGY